MVEKQQRIVIALGGNAISAPSEEGTIDQQFAHAQTTAEQICKVVVEGFLPIITHGNGPQVGNILRRVEIASDELYTIPLEVCVADTQAGMGYMIGQCLLNEMQKSGRDTNVTTVVTTVLVDQADPAFAMPTKPIGPRLKKETADYHVQNDGWHIQEVADNVYRRVVPSPKPLGIIELTSIEQLVQSGHLVISCGGGGIPVTLDEKQGYRGVAAVIDKDRTSALLALQLDVKTLVILTGVEHVCLNFGTPQEQTLDRLSIAKAKQLLAQGQFPEGSMKPKIEAAIEFVESSPHADATAIIAHLDKLSEALHEKSGTRIVRV